MLEIYKDWSKINALNPMPKAAIRNLIPKENLETSEIILGRSELMEIPKAQWSQIGDKEMPDDYAKANFVDSYFCVCVHVLRRNQMIQIAANTSKHTQVTIEHSSAVHNSVKKTDRLETVLEAKGTVKGVELKAKIGNTFEISKENRYDIEDKRKTVEDINYDKVDYDREIVFWDLSKVVVLFRKLKSGSGSVKMVAMDDYYCDTYQKTYNYKD